ncbi:MAG: type IV pilus secretin PilQ, partial [Betaproteobacteria bacterium]|nr:type IV pilus secretin PilQ [Betaproteobacteria bacterium]NBS47499.1 type IV pilus secretin PilQ [Betaproteobacteria bacterium]
EASETFGRSLGVKLGGGNVGVPPSNGHRNLIGTSYDLIASGGNAAASGTALNHPAFVNLPAASLGGLSPAAAAITLFDAGKSRFISLELSALEAEGKGKLVSSPRVVTADKTRARIEQGTEFPYQATDRDGRANTSFRRATLKLDVIPQITPDGNVILEVSVHKDSRGETTSNGVAINTKQITTQVQVDNGGTVVIGGIFEIAENEGEARVPLLGELPGVGALFRSRQRNTSKQELLIFLTPKVVEERTARASPPP